MAKMRTTEGGTIEIAVATLKGQFVKTRRPMRNRWCLIPEGTVCRVDGTWRSGVSLQSPICRRCGVATSISKVHRDDVLVCTKDGRPVDEITDVSSWMPSDIEQDITQAEADAMDRARDALHSGTGAPPTATQVLLDLIQRLRARGER